MLDMIARKSTVYCVIGGAGNIGAASRTEYLVPYDPADPLQLRYLHPDDGGVYPEPNEETVPKFPSQASGIFGVAAPTMREAGSHTRPDGSVLTWKAGERVGRTLTPTRYNGIVVGMKRYEAGLENLFALARRAEYGKKNNQGVARKSVWFSYNGANPYKEHCEDPASTWHGDSWEAHLPKTFTSKHWSIQKLIDGQIDAAEEVMKGATREADFKIYHDRLSQWWEAEAQAHIKARGYEFRQWRAQGSTNALLEAAGDNRKYYIDSSMGDTPGPPPHTPHHPRRVVISCVGLQR